ncbi:J domain-containing protein [Alloalcanivorax profundimaris]|uniref:J domain-containing protein n=1 Tax=Alloalcanivorax profundimaris TaxID=2735259 RepID=UPI001889B84F|nr:J domain-containing protein [Alloalcanivorax profundimaris]MBF1802722.1 J domain-containing protein [Alloalcanivorax profundimaris]
MYYHYVVLKKGEEYLAVLTNPNTQWELGHYYDQGYAFCMDVPAFNASSAVEVVKQNEKSEIVRLQAQLKSLQHDYKKLMQENQSLRFGDRYGQASSINAINPLEVLGFTSAPDQKDLKLRYKQLSLKLHPDKGGSNFLMRLLNDAYAQLKKA